MIKCAALVIEALLLFQCGVSEKSEAFGECIAFGERLDFGAIRNEESEAFENAKHSRKVRFRSGKKQKKAKLSIMRSI